jgi:hypothetical protein
MCLLMASTLLVPSDIPSLEPEAGCAEPVACRACSTDG